MKKPKKINNLTAIKFDPFYRTLNNFGKSLTAISWLKPSNAVLNNNNNNNNNNNKKKKKKKKKKEFY